MNIDVFKFGGVAVGSVEAIRAAVEHVRRAAPRVAAVVSAANGVTDSLHDTAQSALRGDRDAYLAAATRFETRHYDLIAGVISQRTRAEELRKAVLESANEMRSMAESIAVLRELTPRAHDALVARGERIMEKHVLPILESGRVAIMPGYLGSGPEGEVVTLGRGGSDFSAAILARSVDARSVTLFKEVDGLMTADPKSVPSARQLSELHYREAAELAFYGANVLHPRTMIPLLDRKIPLFVRNTFREHSPGTRIADDVKASAYPVKALTAIHRQSLISIEGSGMIGVPGVAGRAFTALSQAGHSVSMISQASSEASICFVLPHAEAAHAVAALEETFLLERKSKLIDRIRAENDVALIAVVGLGMRGRPGIAARTFSALSGARVNVVAIAQGSSELNITVAVAEEDATRALQALHSEYQLDKLHPLADTSGRESKLTFLGFGQIGRELASQLASQEKHLRSELGLDVKVTAVADRSGIRIEENGFTFAALQKLAKQKASGTRLFAGQHHLTLKQLQTMMREELWILPSHRPILIDLTSEETAPLIQEALENGFHIVLANKKPLAVSQIEFDRLMDTAKEHGLALRYEATAGAGLPVLDTLAKLQEAGDRVETIVGAFSGTLGFIMTALEEGKRFSDAVREAWKLGYTEPDPRDDLSGTDVARKALILARTLGRRLELSDVALESLYTHEVDANEPARFVDNLTALDASFADRVARAKREGKVLRYVAKIGKRGIRVGVEAVPVASPLGRLHGTDNTIVIQSKRYATNPLVVTGPGAGAAVTAAGVLNDIVAITMVERRIKGGRTPRLSNRRPSKRRPA